MEGAARTKPLSHTAGEGGSPGPAIGPSPQPSPPMGAREFFGATRRAVLASIAAALMPRPLAAQSQPQAAMRRLGVLMPRLPDDRQGQASAGAIVAVLTALGWHEGGNLHIDWRWAGGEPALYERCAAELVALGSDVILAGGSPSIAALRLKTSTIPTVFAAVIDPVGQGFVASLGRPGGNITGFTTFDPLMGGKWLEMLTLITPPVAGATILYNPANAPYAGLILRTIEDAAASLGVAVRAASVHDDTEIEAMMAGLAREEHGGVLVMPEAFVFAHGAAIVASAARYSLPAVYPDRRFAAAGGLMSYGPDIIASYRGAAAYVDRILKGAKPSDLPVQNPTKFELVLNLKAAKALGVTFPPSLTAGADEVIE